MNKLFTKVAALTLGVAMAAGVGVAVGASQKASAAEATSYDAVMAKGNNAYDDNTINGKYSIKAGASSKQGSMTITIPSASAKTLSFYAAAWKGDSTTVDVSSTGVTLSVSSLQLTNDSALSGTGSTWTLDQDEETYLFELDLTDCTENAVVTLTAHVASKNRFFVWGAQYDDGESGDVVDVTGVSLDEKSADLVIPNSATLTATVTPENATNKKVSWSSSNSLVASVANGVVKAVDQGTATITVTTQDGSFTDECVVTVSLPTITDVTVAQAIDIGAALSDGATSTDYYRVTGYVVAITYEYAQGTMSFTLADEKGGTSTVTCYKFACTEEEAAKIVVDARVSLVGNIQNYVKSSVHTYEFVNNIRSQTAFPEEPVTDWSNEQKTALGTALHGYVPPFFGELVEDLTTTENSARFTVSGDHSAEFASKLGDGWEPTDTNNYMKVGDNYYLTASIYVEGVKAVGDYYSYFEFAYHEGQPIQEFTVTYLPGNGTGESIEIDVEEGSSHTLRSLDETSFVAPEGQQFKGWQVDNDAELRAPGYVLENIAGNVTVTAIYEDIPVAGWSSEMLSAFETVLHGVIPSYDDSVASLEYVSDYSDFEMPFVATEEEALAELAILCKDWNFDSEYKEYSINTPDGLGEAIGWVYTDTESGSSSATIQFNQTHYPAALEAEMEQHMHGNIPPVLANGVDGFVYYEGADMFVTSGAYNISVLSTFQTFATRKGLVLIDSGTEKRPVAAASYTELEGTAYKYGGLCSDGGIIVVELFALTQYSALTINIYYLAQPLSIALSGEYNTEFEYGEQLDTTGMVVTATMSDETEQDVTSSAQFSGYDSLKEGEQTVTVTVGSASTTYTVTVKEKVLQKIDVTSEPTKVVYKVGEEFNPEGLEVTATYNGGDPVVLDLADVEISGFDSSTSGEKTITVAFGGKTTSFTVTVEQGYDADAFAKDLLDMVAPICANYDGKKNNKAALKTVWDTMSQRYSTLSNEEKAKVIAAAAKADGTDLEKAMAFYNYACKKYGLTKFIEGRQVKALVAEHETGNSILPIVVIVASSVAAITAIGVVIALKRRKTLLAK